MTNFEIHTSPSHLKHLTFYIWSAIGLILDLVGLIFLKDYGIIVYVGSFLIALFIIVRVVYQTLYTELYEIRVNKNAIEFRTGVFNKVVESIEMHRIKDFLKKSSFVDQLLGLATVIIHSTDHTTPIIIFSGILNEDAKRIVKFLQKNASDSIVKHYIKNKKIPSDPIIDERITSQHNRKKDVESVPNKNKARILEP